jgi:hypothetical protein
MTQQTFFNLAALALLALLTINTANIARSLRRIERIGRQSPLQRPGGTERTVHLGRRSAPEGKIEGGMCSRICTVHMPSATDLSGGFPFEI